MAQLERMDQIDSLRIALCDLNGNWRGKRIAKGDLQKALNNQVRMPLSVVGVDVWGEDVSAFDFVLETGDKDGMCEYTQRPVFIADWFDKPVAWVPVWLAHEDGSPFLCDPRRALQNILQRYQRQGLTPVVATELEFYLFDPKQSPPCPPRSPLTGKRLHGDEILSLSEVNEFEAYFADVYRACELNGIPADSAISENGCGQFEINLLHVDDALKSADDAVLFKQIVKGIARKHGFAASFMAKPYGHRSGNGLHVHMSLLDAAGNNVFDNGTLAGSEVLLHAVGGLLATMQDSTLVFAPHYNSYKRFAPGALAPTNITWGYENRTAAIRIPGGVSHARRIEHRVAGADANPYLVLTTILSAVLYGLEHQIKPGAPLDGNAYEHQAESLHLDWLSAITAFNHSQPMREFFGDALCDMFVAAKQQEFNVFANNVSRFEYDSYLEVI